MATSTQAQKLPSLAALKSLLKQSTQLSPASYDIESALLYWDALENMSMSSRSEAAISTSTTSPEKTPKSSGDTPTGTWKKVVKLKDLNGPFKFNQSKVNISLQQLEKKKDVYDWDDIELFWKAEFFTPLSDHVVFKRINYASQAERWCSGEPPKPERRTQPRDSRGRYTRQQPTSVPEAGILSDGSKTPGPLKYGPNNFDLILNGIKYDYSGLAGGKPDAYVGGSLPQVAGAAPGSCPGGVWLSRYTGRDRFALCGSCSKLGTIGNGEVWHGDINQGQHIIIGAMWCKREYKHIHLPAGAKINKV